MYTRAIYTSEIEHKHKKWRNSRNDWTGWSILASGSSCKTNFYCKPPKTMLFCKQDIRNKLTQSVILKCNLCNKTTVKLYNEQMYVIGCFCVEVVVQTHVGKKKHIYTPSMKLLQRTVLLWTFHTDNPYHHHHHHHYHYQWHLSTILFLTSCCSEL